MTNNDGCFFVAIWIHSVLIKSICSLLIAMLLIAAVELSPTSILIFQLLQLRIDIDTFVLSHFCDLPFQELVVMLLHRWFIGILQIFNLHDRIIFTVRLHTVLALACATNPPSNIAPSFASSSAFSLPSVINFSKSDVCCLPFLVAMCLDVINLDQYFL